jgi:MFS family permease
LTSYSIGYGLSLLVIGRFASAWGYKRTVAIGFIGIGFLYLILQWAESYSAFHIIFFSTGFASGMYLPSVIPIITETYGSRHWGKAIGVHDSAASFSMFVIPILVTFGLHFLQWRRLLLILGATALLLPICFWKVSIEPKQERSQQTIGYLVLFRKQSMWIMGLIWILPSACCNGVYSILTLYLVKERGIDFDYANTMIGISCVCGIFVTFLAGFLADRFGYKKILMMSILAAGLTTVALSLASTVTLILVTLVLQVNLSSTFFPVATAAISKLTPLSGRSLATGVIISIGMIFGTGVTPFFLGVIADHLNFQTGIFGLGILTIFSSLTVGLLRETKDVG